MSQVTLSYENTYWPESKRRPEVTCAFSVAGPTLSHCVAGYLGFFTVFQNISIYCTISRGTPGDFLRIQGWETLM